MRIRVELIGELRNRLQRGEEHWDLEVKEGLTIRELVDEFNLRAGLFGASVNGCFVEEDYCLEDDATVLLFPHAAGG